jgi:hypothetical protein
MIRIDEIYQNTFWPWFDKNRPGTRVLFCDPPGHTAPEHLFNLCKEDIVETDYVFFHDQEPADLDLYQALFDKVLAKGAGGLGCSEFPDGQWRKVCSLLNHPGHVVVSERGSFVKELCEKYQWQSHYYFYHGWACQDWFRGYDKTFLIPRAEFRTPTRTFMSPNRIVGGKRDHRVLFLYHVFQQGLENNYISAPRTCPAENINISTAAQKYYNIYSDIEQVLDRAELPRTFSGEQTQQMTSCWLTNFDESADSLLYVPTETVYFGQRLHLTEKTFKAIALEMPFALIAPAGSLSYLREYGFKTFGSVFDESYDEEIDDIKRLEKVVKLLKDLDSLTIRERCQIHRACLPTVQHNFNHFYRGGFADVLWKELTTMLRGMCV